MIRVVVEVAQRTSWDTRRHVLAVEHVQVGRPGRGCHALVPVHFAGRRVRFIPCGRRLPRDQQCPGCTVTITTRTTSTTTGTTSSTGRLASEASRGR